MLTQKQKSLKDNTHYEDFDLLVEDYLKIFHHRKSELFHVFLKNGYSFTTIDSVSIEDKKVLVQAKCFLGFYITLIDDFADNPNFHSLEILDLLSPKVLALSEGEICSASKSNSHIGLLKKKQAVGLAKRALKGFFERIRLFPHFDNFSELLNHDLEMIVITNRYSAITARHQFLSNQYECRLYGSYNMGMVASSTLDLMRLPSLDLSEIGKCREIFYMAQRMGRIANVLTTYQREIQEGDVSNEIVHRLSTDRSLNFSECQEEMEIEFDKLFSKICGMKNEIKCFSVESFAKSIRRLLTFHKALIGLI